MTKNKRRIISALLALVLLLGVTALAAPGGNSTFRYEYVMLPVKDGTADGEVLLDLYVSVVPVAGNVDPNTPAGPFLDNGAFGFKFPDWISQYTFTPDESVSLVPTVPAERYTYAADSYEVRGEGYHAFSWTGKQAELDGAISYNWVFNDTVGGYCLKLGRYSLTLPQTDGKYRLPAGYEVGLLDWLTVDESIPKEVGESVPDGNDAFNLTVFNPVTGLYQGYYLAAEPETPEDALLTQTDIGFRMITPKAWASTLKILSYDPKKPVTVKLYDESDELVGTVKTAAWDGADIADEIYSATAANGDSGIGAYYSTVHLDTCILESGKSIEEGETYYLKVTKAGHIGFTLTLTAGGSELSQMKGFPSSGTVTYLPVGDLDASGRIDMTDRGALLAVLGKGSGVIDGPAYVADLDGDGVVTMSDLSVLVSPMNYTKTQAEEVSE